jgi:hypothetical protein
MSGYGYESVGLGAIRPVRKAEVRDEDKARLTLPLPDVPSAGPTELSRTELPMPAPLPARIAFVLHNVLSRDECAHLVGVCEDLGFSFWNAPGEAGSGEKRVDFRDADTIEATHAPLADYLWERMRPLIEPTVELAPGHPHWQRDLDGTWDAVGVNPCSLIGRYVGGGHFAPHTDGYTIVDFNERSLYSVIVYLNDCDEGGATRLQRDEQLQDMRRTEAGAFTGSADYLIHSVRPELGAALVFYQTIVHEGEPVGPASRKYFIRTDIMYRRRNPKCNSVKDREAYRMYEQAQEMSAAGDADEALVLFRRAFKMSPALAEALGS